MEPLHFLPPPYTYIKNIDVTENGWTVPNNVIICELRCVADSSTDLFYVSVSTKDQSGDHILKGRCENIWRLEISHIRKFGTTPAVRNGCIEVYGYYRDQVHQFTG